MERAVASLSVAVFLACAVFGQSTETPPAFEIADIHGSAHGPNQYMRGGAIRGGRYELRTATIVDLIATAYGVSAEKVYGGPSWLEMDRFDVIAKAPADATKEMVKPMLQALLADRFKLVVHNDSKPVPAYALTVGKHPTLKKSDGTGETGCKNQPNQAAGRSGPIQAGVPTFPFSCRNMTMAAFAEALRNDIPAFQYLGNNLVVDKTGLEGSWDFDFKFTLRGGPMASSADVITIFDAVDKQLGLKLDPGNVPMPVIVVDSVNRTPSGNVPGVAERLPVVLAPTGFEVAMVKPTDPDAKGMMGIRIQRGGQVTITGITLKTVIQQAWGLTDDMLVGAPKWLDTDHFDIIAKAPTAGPEAGASSGGGDVDFDSVWLMMRSLLADRFKLATHMEERPVPAYTLLAVKPKLKTADPASRTKCKEGPASLDAKDPRNANPSLSRLITCQNMTMAQFADRLQSLAGGYIHSPVLDATGLEGAFDFTLSFSPAGMFNNRGRGGDAQPASAATTEAPDPGAGLTLLEAMEKQLGLKLQPEKRPISVLVIDHVEQKPTDN